jgi:DNA-directed RNA polymerase specialized sigma24 family protein
VVVGRAADHGSPGLPSGHPQPPSREPNPADDVEHTELHALLRALVDELPAAQREAIDLWADGFSYMEISRIIDKQEGHVRVLVHRGLKTLREHPQVRAVMGEESSTGSGGDKKPKQKNNVSPVHGACSP